METGDKVARDAVGVTGSAAESGVDTCAHRRRAAFRIAALGLVHWYSA